MRSSPCFAAAGRHDELAAVLELRLRAQTEPADRTRTLRAMAEVAESSLGDPERAQSALLRALAEEPQDGACTRTSNASRTRAGREGWQRYADALQERADAIFDANVAADLFVRLGKVSEEKLDDPSRASKAYLSAVERMGDDPGVLASARPTLRASRRHESSGRRARAPHRGRGRGERAGGPLHRLASLQIGEFGEKSQGLATLRQALERVPDHVASRAALEKLLEDDALFDDAFDALEFVLRALGLSEELGEALRAARVARPRCPAIARTRGSSWRACSRSASGISRERSVRSRLPIARRPFGR